MPDATNVVTAMRRAPNKIPILYAPIPLDMLTDYRISNHAKVAFANLVECRKGNRVRMSEDRLAERMRRSPRQAHRLLHALIAHGYIVPVNVRNGRCGEYLIPLLTHDTFDSGSVGKPMTDLTAVQAKTAPTLSRAYDIRDSGPMTSVTACLDRDISRGNGVERKRGDSISAPLTSEERDASDIGFERFKRDLGPKLARLPRAMRRTRSQSNLFLSAISPSSQAGRCPLNAPGAISPVESDSSFILS